MSKLVLEDVNKNRVAIYCTPPSSSIFIVTSIYGYITIPDSFLDNQPIKRLMFMRGVNVHDYRMGIQIQLTNKYGIEQFCIDAKLNISDNQTDPLEYG